MPSALPSGCVLCYVLLEAFPDMLFCCHDFCYVANPQTRAGGMLRGQTQRVLKACFTCKTQEMPEEEEEEEEEEAEGEEVEESAPPPQTRVGKVRGPTCRVKGLACVCRCQRTTPDCGSSYAVVWALAAYGRLPGKAQAADLEGGR